MWGELDRAKQEYRFAMVQSVRFSVAMSASFLLLALVTLVLLVFSA